MLLLLGGNFAGIIAVIVGILVLISFKVLLRVSFEVLLRLSLKAFSWCHNRYHKGNFYCYHLGHCGGHCRGIDYLCPFKYILGIIGGVFAGIHAGYIAVSEGNFQCYCGRHWGYFGWNHNGYHSRYCCG